LLKNIQYYKELFDNVIEPILLIEGNAFVDGNQAALKILGMSSKDELFVIHPMQISPEFQPDGELSQIKAERMINICYQQGFNRFEWQHQTVENEQFLVEVTLRTIQINNKTMLHVVWRETKGCRKYKEALNKQQSLLSQKDDYIKEINSLLQKNKDSDKNIIESLKLLEEYKNAIDESSIVSKTDLDGIITYVNNKFCELSGYSREELLGQNHNIIRHPDTPAKNFENLWKTIQNKQIFKAVIKNRRKNGETCYVDSTVVPILDNDNNIVEYIGIRHDVTLLHQRDRIIHEQFTDELTSLPNRQKLLMDMKELVFPKLAIINIDRFKDINDSYGLEIGDEILVNITTQLLKCRSLNLNVYRISGDIFALLAIGNYSFKKLQKTCKNLIIHMEKEAYVIKDNTFYLSFTSGMAAGEDRLLTHAEIALSSAKKEDQGFVIFDEKMPSYKKLMQNIELTKTIKYALLHDHLLLFGQKIINNKTGDIKYETLMRIKTKEGKILSPFIFLEHAKKARLYPFMTRVVIEKACHYFMNKNTSFSINLDIQDIHNTQTIDFLLKTIQETNTANQIILEIVESEGIEQFEKVSNFIRRVKSIGCKVAIDDFGTGYSNFEYIIRLNVDILKIDGSLIKDIHINNDLKLTVSTIVSFAKKLNMEVVAEFVHCKEVLDIIKELNIPFSQGFFLHEPEQLL